MDKKEFLLQQIGKFLSGDQLPFTMAANSGASSGYWCKFRALNDHLVYKN